MQLPQRDLRLGLVYFDLPVQRRLDHCRQRYAVRDLRERVLPDVNGRMSRRVLLAASSSAQLATNLPWPRQYSMRPLLCFVLRSERHLLDVPARSPARLVRRHQVRHGHDRLDERHLRHLPRADLLELVLVVLRRLQPAVRVVLRSRRGRVPELPQPERPHAERGRVRRV